MYDDKLEIHSSALFGLYKLHHTAYFCGNNIIGDHEIKIGKVFQHRLVSSRAYTAGNKSAIVFFGFETSRATIHNPQ
jgi:hypothetical protein